MSKSTVAIVSSLIGPPSVHDTRSLVCIAASTRRFTASSRQLSPRARPTESNHHSVLRAAIGLMFEFTNLAASLLYRQSVGQKTEMASCTTHTIDISACSGESAVGPKGRPRIIAPFDLFGPWSPKSDKWTVLRYPGKPTDRPMPALQMGGTGQPLSPLPP